MERYVRPSRIIGMTDLNPKKTALPVVIWVDHNGISRSVSHRNTPRVKIGIDEAWASVTISSEPKVLTKSKNMKQSEWRAIQKGIDYIARNYDLFLKHYVDQTYDYDDDELKADLRTRGEYK